MIFAKGIAGKYLCRFLRQALLKKAMTYLDIVLQVRVQDLVQNLGDMIDSWLEGSYRDSCPDILSISVFLRMNVGDQS